MAKYPWQTGFCSIKHCEGTSPKGILTGTPMKTCEMWEDCACNCHVQVTKMFELLGMPRQLQVNPAYKPVERTWWMPSAEDRVMMQAEKLKVEQKIVFVESVLPDILPPSAIREFTETPTGIRQSGQLEDEVRRVTDGWVAVSNLGEVSHCTPTKIAAQINSDNPPSTGAVAAVLDRWVSYGFCTMAKKPTRFLGYTEEGIKKGLHVMKSEYKMKNKKMSSSFSKGR